MVEIRRTEIFSDWLAGLRDQRAAARVAIRIDRLAAGNPGDVKPVGGGVSELRVDYGPGYRVYFLRRGQLVIILLCGGEKGTQDQDLRTAKTLAKQLKE